MPVSELAQWQGSMLAGLGNIAIPEPDIIKPPSSVSNGGAGDPGVYWDKADLRIVLRTGPGIVGNLPGGPVLNHRIEVVNAGGVVDVVRTVALYNFMTDGAWNNRVLVGRGPSTYRGTMPIFITDVPTAASGCTDVNPGCNANQNRGSYAPTLPAPALGNRFSQLPSGTYSEFMSPAQPGLGAPFAFDRDYRRGGFYNWREGRWMLLLNINARDLMLWNQQNGQPFFASNDSSEGGIVIFATIAGPDSNDDDNNYGIRIFGTADIPLPGGIDVSADPTGLTVASDQAIYVLGDFNRGVVNGGTPRQPASIIGDSVNVLSQNYWQGQGACNTALCRDGQSTQGLGNAARDAMNTWINGAFLGGVDTTDAAANNYNGGLENYPRFHEDWAGFNLTYQGSFVSLGEPEHVNGPWCGTGGGCNIYNPPVRLWNFEPGYNDAANLPPLTPRFVYVQQVLFTEDFK
jgi:hypothetical protein